MDMGGRRKQARYRVSFTLLAPPLNIGRPPDDDLLRGDVVSRLVSLTLVKPPKTLQEPLLALLGQCFVKSFSWLAAVTSPTTYPVLPLLTDEPISTPGLQPAPLATAES
jgi:hypothetical protein